MRRLLFLPVLLLAFGLLAGCAGTGSGGDGGSRSEQSIQHKLRQLRNKVPLLEADECYSGNLRAVFPNCDKYVTELDSTTGALRNTLAHRGPRQRKAVEGLEAGLRKYHQLSCGVVRGTPSDKQQRECPRSLVKIHNSLETLNEALQGTPTTR